ncbi:MAG: phosphomannomutase/phosphoglucomutase [Deltaproteobacteria bacterium]|nr:phosphomannomutase/phosphoglucomutase [Deltaproteobacteria bacterium]
MNPEVFREYDIRGIVDKDLTEDFIYDLGRAIGTYGHDMGVATMSLGRDCRLSSERYLDTLSRGLTAAGIDVIDIGLCATPMLYFSIRRYGTDGGVMITGSHNPPDFNGFKVCIGPDTIYGEEIQNLRTIMETGSYRRGNGTRERRQITKEYQDFIFQNVDISRRFSIAVDGGNGVGGYFAVPLLERLGCTVVPLYCEPDGRFPNHHPDPTVEDNLTELIDIVKEQRLDVGISFDGDADRIGVVTDTGTILWGDELLVVFSRAILKENPGSTIIGEVKCSQKLYDDIARHGGRPIMWKAGHSLIKGKMREEKAVLAGEMSGHLFFADKYFGYDDAIYGAVRLLEVLSKNGGKLSDLVVDLPKSFATPEIRVDCPDMIKFAVVDRVKEHLSKDYEIIDIDGARVNFGNGWGLVRASNTQPVLVLRFESWTQEGLSAIKERMETIVSALIRQVMEKTAR